MADLEQAQTLIDLPEVASHLCVNDRHVQRLVLSGGSRS